MKLLTSSLVIAALIGTSIVSAHAAPKYSFKKGQLVKVTGGSCGLISNKWKAVKKSGKKKYVLDKRNRGRCASLLSPTSLRKSGLANIPSAAKLIQAADTSTAILAVSGNPPAVTSIPAVGAKNVFWTPGLVDTVAGAPSPTQGQCNEFFHGSTDGSSSGLLGCYAVQGVAFSFQSILEGGTSACFMKRIPSQENIDSGAISVVDGKLPSGGITRLFSTPSGSKSRLVKILISGMGGPSENGFIRITSTNNLAKKGNQYAYNLWFCQDGEAQANNFEESSISLSGVYKFLNVFVNGSNEYQNEITAQLTKDGSEVTFDTSKERTAKSTGEFGGSSFKSSVTISGDNTIRTKVREVFNGFARSNFGVAQFSGANTSDFAVRAAALKDDFGGQTQAAGIEYRDSLYTSAPESSLLSDLDEVNLATDTFYSEAGSVDADFSDKSCSADADVTISMDFTNPAMQQIASECEGQRLQNMDFCRSDSTIIQALTKCAQ